MRHDYMCKDIENLAGDREPKVFQQIHRFFSAEDKLGKIYITITCDDAEGGRSPQNHINHLSGIEVRE